jgi:hypothetical protein
LEENIKKNKTKSRIRNMRKDQKLLIKIEKNKRSRKIGKEAQVAVHQVVAVLHHHLLDHLQVLLKILHREEGERARMIENLAKKSIHPPTREDKRIVEIVENITSRKKKIKETKADDKSQEAQFIVKKTNIVKDLETIKEDISDPALVQTTMIH